MEGTYKKNKGNAGLEGVQFQLDLLLVFLLNAVQNLKNWKISSENQDAGKYDDLVLELPDKSVLLQAKFKQNKKINRDQLLSSNSKNSDFSLPKYFFSYLKIKSKLKDKTIIICTNTDVNQKELQNMLTHNPVCPDSMLYYEGTSSQFLTFNKNILPDLKESAEVYLDKNLQGIGIDKAVITDENIEDFLNNLQIFYNYPSGKELQKVIEQLLSRLNNSSLYRKVSCQEIYKKIEDWFKQPRGEYLTEVRVKAMLCEIKSEKYCEILKGYDVSFRNTYLNFTNKERIFHIKTEGGNLLQVLKIYHTLQMEESKKLYVNPEDDIEVQKQVIETFELPQYSFLIIVNKITNKAVLREMGGKLKDALEKNKYKKIIVVDSRRILIKIIGLKDTSYINGSVTFTDLSNESQDKLLNRKNINFQSKLTSVKKILVTPTDDYTKFLDPKTLEKLIRAEEVKIGIRLLDLDVGTARYYIHRTFEREFKIEETTNEYGVNIYPEENIYDVNEKVILIADTAGMGKSTILIKLAVTLKEKYPYLWVIRINLNDYTRILSHSLRNDKQTISVIELLNSQESTKLTNQLEKLVFSMKAKVVLMLDALDEISPNYTSLIINLLTQCHAQPNFAKILVTTRPHVSQEIETTLKVGSFKMLPFSEQDQVNFLTRYWAHNLRFRGHTKREKCKRYAETLIYKTYSWIKSYEWENTFPAIPLHVRMLAEIFQENVGQLEVWEGCREYLIRDETEAKLPEEFNSTKLYDTFIEKKRYIFLDKGNPSGNAAANEALSSQFDEYLIYHRSLALELILHKTQRHLFSNCPQFNKDIEASLLKIGIVQKSLDGLQFTHRTFAEYFVADSILRELQLQNQNVEFQRFLIDEVLLKPQFKLIRFIFDSLLQKCVDSLPPDMFSNYQSTHENGLEYVISYENPIFLLAREGCVAIFRLILNSTNFKITNKIITIGSRQLTIKHVRNNMLNNLQALIRKSGFNITNIFGDSLLHLAVKQDRLEMTKFLIEQGADINVTDSGDRTALHLAALRSELNCMKCLVEHGIDVNVRDKDGRTALHLAAFKCKLDTVKYLLKCGAGANISDNDDRTALHLAAERGDLNTTKCLVEHSASVNIRDKNGTTALHSATKRGTLDIVKYFVECGADIDVRDNFDRTALHLAVEESELEIVKYLVEHSASIDIRDSDGRTVLHLAAKKDKLDILKYLVELGADVNVRDSDGRTVLHLASEDGVLETVKYLILLGVDIHVKDDKGRTALHCAVQFKHLHIIKHLTKQGVDANVGDNYGRAALHYAVEKGELDIAKYLVELGVDINVRDHDGRTALHLPASRGYNYTVEYLVEHGADINVRDNDGRTALYLLTVKGYLCTVGYLVAYGADINLSDNKGHTALHWAAEWDQLDTVKLLVELGADINVKDNEDRTPLQLAAFWRHKNTVEYLKQTDISVKSGNADRFWKWLINIFKKRI